MRSLSTRWRWLLTEVSSALVVSRRGLRGRRSGLDKKRAATQEDEREVCTEHYLSTDGTGEEYYIDVQTVIEKNGMVDWLSKGVVAQKSRRGCVFFFSRRRRFDVWVAGGDRRGCFR